MDSGHCPGQAITADACADLGLAEGSAVVALITSTEVSLATA
ncbi:hypothetical protein ATKI12_4486 [Kitasatospora sp. Ki12]